MSIVTGGLYTATVQGLFDGLIQTVNTYHFKCVSQGVEADTPAMVMGGLYVHLFHGGVLDLLSVSQSFVGMKLDYLNPAGDVVNTYEMPLASPFSLHGVTEGDCLPPQAVVTVKKIRPAGFRRHGWNRYSGVPEVAQSKGVLQYNVTALETIAAKHTGVFRSGVWVANSWQPHPTSEYQFLHFKREEGGLPLVTMEYAPLVAASVRPFVGSQNSRKHGVGV